MDLIKQALVWQDITTLSAIKGKVTAHSVANIELESPLGTSLLFVMMGGKFHPKLLTKDLRGMWIRDAQTLMLNNYAAACRILGFLNKVLPDFHMVAHFPTDNALLSFYHGHINHQNASKQLELKNSGDHLIRRSSRCPEKLSITWKLDNGTTKTKSLDQGDVSEHLNSLKGQAVTNCTMQNLKTEAMTRPDFYLNPLVNKSNTSMLLHSRPNGSYLLSDQQTPFGAITLSWVKNEGEIVHQSLIPATDGSGWQAPVKETTWTRDHFASLDEAITSFVPNHQAITIEEELSLGGLTHSQSISHFMTPSFTGLVLIGCQFENLNQAPDEDDLLIPVLDWKADSIKAITICSSTFDATFLNLLAHFPNVATIQLFDCQFKSTLSVLEELLTQETETREFTLQNCTYARSIHRGDLILNSPITSEKIFKEKTSKQNISIYYDSE